jgi:hypothetical protein
MKILLCFYTHRNSRCDKFDRTPLEEANRKERPEFIELIEEFLPSEEEKLDLQFEFYRSHKAIIDNTFIGEKIRLMFLSLDAVKYGDLALLKMAIPHVNIHMAISLATVAIDYGNIHLLEELRTKILGEPGVVDTDDPDNNSLNRRTSAGLTVFDKLVATKISSDAFDPLLLIGLDAAPYSSCMEPKPSTFVEESVNTARILCIMKILFDKQIYVDMDITYELVQTLIGDGMY